MEKTKKHIGVLGGGPCGLYAARVLTKAGHRVTILDKGERPGGLASSYYCGKNWYDFGVHMLHAFDQDIFQDIKSLMGDERIEVELNAKIKWAGGSYRYPLQFQDMIKGIPFFKLCRQVIALFGAQFKNMIAPWEAQNAEQALIQLYGKPLYEFFFEDFTHRYWEIHPRELSATFIKAKMPKLTAVDVLKKGLEKIGIKQRAQATESALTTETLHYSANGAEAMTRCLARSIIESGSDIIQQATVCAINTDHTQSTIEAVEYQHQGETKTLRCDAYLSTIPLNNFVQALNPSCPAEVAQAASFIRYKAIVIYGLLVNKQRCLKDTLYVYYRDRIFHRVGEPKNAGLKVEPADHTVLIVEMTCNVGDAKWRGDESIKQQIFADLSAEGICDQQDVMEVHINTHEHAYPIFSLGFESHLALINQHIDQFSNLVSAGRQGAFTYPNMHSAMRMGWNAAEKLCG